MASSERMIARERSGWEAVFIDLMHMCVYLHLHWKNRLIRSAFTFPFGKCKYPFSWIKYSHLWNCLHLFLLISHNSLLNTKDVDHWDLVNSPVGCQALLTSSLISAETNGAFCLVFSFIPWITGLIQIPLSSVCWIVFLLQSCCTSFCKLLGRDKSLHQLLTGFGIMLLMLLNCWWMSPAEL